MKIDLRLVETQENLASTSRTWYVLGKDHYPLYMYWRKFLFTLLMGSAVGALSLHLTSKVLAADDDLIDRQDTAVATNLGLFGGLPQDITVDPNDDGQYVYIATYTPNGVFSSSDAGETWLGLPGEVDYGAGKAVLVDPNSGDVYAAIGDDLIKSQDHGSTWTSLTDNLAGESPLVGSDLGWTDGTLIVAVDNGAVQVSSDGGQTFTSVTLAAGLRNNVISTSGNDEGEVYAILQDFDTSDTTLFYSANHGTSWTAMNVTSAGVSSGSEFYDVSIDPLNFDHVILSSYNPNYQSYQTFNGGTTWTSLLNAGSRIGGQKAVFDGVGGLYLGVYYTSNVSVASPTWSALETDTPLSSIRGDIYAVDAVHPTTVYANTPMGVAKSQNNGSDWVDSVDGITAVKSYSVSQAEDKDVLWIGANGGLAKTINFTDEHPDWEYPILPTESASNIYAVWVKPGNADYVVTAASNFFYYTEDGGDSWTQADAPDFTGTVEVIIPSPRNQQTLYGLYTNTSLTEDAYNGGVMKSSDAGKTWEELNFPTTLANGDVAVAVADDQDILYVGIGAGGSEQGIYKYSDTTWEKLEADFGIFSVNNLLVHPENNNSIYASFEDEYTVGALYRSQDAGVTWEELTEGLDDTNHLGPMAAQTGETTTLYLAGQDGTGGYGALYKSTDGGDSWSQYYQGKKQEFFYALLFDGLISGNDRGVYDFKSLGKVVLKKNKQAAGTYDLHVTLKDAPTKVVLAHKELTVYKKPIGKYWRAIQVDMTNKSGKHTFRVKGKKGDKFKVVWKPSEEDQAEYTRSVSRVLSI